MHTVGVCDSSGKSMKTAVSGSQAIPLAYSHRRKRGRHQRVPQTAWICWSMSMDSIDAGP